MKKTSFPFVFQSTAARIVTLAAVAAMLYIAGMGVYYYQLMSRVSEDAYATAAWSVTSRRAADMASFVQSMVSDIGLQAPVLSAGVETDEFLSGFFGEYQNIVSGAFRLDAQNAYVSGYPLGAGNGLSIPVFYVSSNAVARARNGMATFCDATEDDSRKALFNLFVPIFDGPVYDGIFGVTINYDSFVERFLSGLQGSVVDRIYLRDSKGWVRDVFLKRPEYAASGHGRTLRTEDLVVADKPGTAGYAITVRNGEKFLETFTAVSMPGAEWSIVLAVPYRTVRLAPHAFFKGGMIISAWALPVIVIMVLLSIRTLMTGAENRERSILHGEIENAQGRLLELIQILPQAVYITFDYTGEISFFSDKIEKITGYTPVELIADPKLWNNIIKPDQKAMVMEKRAMLSEKKTGFKIRYDIKRLDGQWTTIEEAAAPVLDASGGIIQIVGLIGSFERSFVSDDSHENGLVNMVKDMLPEKDVQTVFENRVFSRSGKGNVLFVDDDHLLVSLFAGRLKEAGYGITTAYNGLEAVEEYSKRPDFFDVVVLDMVMPKMSGLEAVSHLKKINPKVKIVGISGYSKDGKEWNLSKQGVMHFLSKPFDHEELIRVINEALAVN